MSEYLLPLQNVRLVERRPVLESEIVRPSTSEKCVDATTTTIDQEVDAVRPTADSFVQFTPSLVDRMIEAKPDLLSVFIEATPVFVDQSVGSDYEAEAEAVKSEGAEGKEVVETESPTTDNNDEASYFLALPSPSSLGLFHRPAGHSSSCHFTSHVASSTCPSPRCMLEKIPRRRRWTTRKPSRSSSSWLISGVVGHFRLCVYDPFVTIFSTLLIRITVLAHNVGQTP